MTGAGPLVTRWEGNPLLIKIPRGAVGTFVTSEDADKLEAIVRAADALRREIEFAPCRDNEDHSRCLRCAAINAYDPVREEL